MTSLPKEFDSHTRTLFGEETYHRFIASFGQPAPVSIRLNPFKPMPHPDAQPIPWCRDAYWLDQRPDFTLDPLLHAGCYYVQEAGSMFLDRVMRQHVTQPSSMLDLCAAPGGKSTLARAALPEGSILYSNDPDSRRANILMENMQKQGHPGVVVTNNFANEYSRTKLRFDVILADVPCSGEGMFRKDSESIAEWSIQHVIDCRNTQRRIIEDIWHCLSDGGLLIYSTCTFNTKENEENVMWIAEELGADILPVDTDSSWHITGSLLQGFDSPVYRFIPGVTRSEGLFMAVLRKHGEHIPAKRTSTVTRGLRVLHDGNPKPTVKGKDIIPAHAEALMTTLAKDKYPRQELQREQALAYLRHEAITLGSNCPRGIVVVCYDGHPLGFVKNIGNRANNLYPQSWRIRKSI